MNVNLRHKVSQLANDDQTLFGYVANMKNCNSSNFCKTYLEMLYLKTEKWLQSPMM